MNPYPGAHPRAESVSFSFETFPFLAPALHELTKSKQRSTAACNQINSANTYAGAADSAQPAHAVLFTTTMAKEVVRQKLRFLALPTLKEGSRKNRPRSLMMQATSAFISVKKKLQAPRGIARNHFLRGTMRALRFFTIARSLKQY